MEPFDPTMDVRVLIACEDSTTAGPACGLLESLGHDCGPDGRLIYRWWNFEVLTIATLREMASREAAKADVIVLTIQHARRLPREVADWMKRCFELRDGRRGALVALLDANFSPTDISGGIGLQLRELAASGNLDFFASTAHLGKDRTGIAQFNEATRRFTGPDLTWRVNQFVGRKDRNRNLGNQTQRPHIAE